MRDIVAEIWVEGLGGYGQASGNSHDRHNAVRKNDGLGELRRNYCSDQLSFSTVMLPACVWIETDSWSVTRDVEGRPICARLEEAAQQLPRFRNVITKSSFVPDSTVEASGNR